MLSKKKEQNWNLWFLLPLYPYQQRPTLRQEVIKDTIWTFEQPHGLLYAVVPIRMTIIKLNTGGLLVYCPIAPTPECVNLVRELENQHGKVKYIIHSTSSGLEHKIFVGPFARYFSTAEVWSAPSQWSFPINLPLTWLGFPRQRTKILPLDYQESPFADEFQYHILDIDLSQGSFVEVALLHKSSKTLLVTDIVIKIPQYPPKIIELNLFPLLFHARESALDNLENTEENRLKGWQRICLFALYFRPSMIETIPLKQFIQEAINAPNRSRANYFGLYPFRWQQNWQKSFEAIANREIPLVAPILETLILPEAPQSVINWATYISTWDFNNIIPAHFSAPIKATPRQFRQAFSFLEKNPFSGQNLYPSGNDQIYQKDSIFIKQLEKTLVKLNIAKPRKNYE
ncbi:DUF4336 domain-containing protein [Geminocystis sp. GBBB08]|uniref:DUF4336 domain-containing protein n=1 Tax=Geminocystis sp. GBBB08 TaxID=2604140 RepID=UPI0027E3163C|nr:DUF4336 domain-containing protein [Geminocystis sp. GBBB08]MBL1211306.1 DUF4336 domain-containing protein [Geminocystis sp. GBBB08]